MTSQLERHHDALRAAVRDLDEASPEQRPAALKAVAWFLNSPFPSVRAAALRAMAEAAPPKPGK